MTDVLRLRPGQLAGSQQEPPSRFPILGERRPLPPHLVLALARLGNRTSRVELCLHGSGRSTVAGGIHPYPRTEGDRTPRRGRDPWRLRPKDLGYSHALAKAGE
jgi:hypothetical protein